MNALAQALVAEGYEVSGSDRYYDRGQDMDVIRKLRESGVCFTPQDGSGITARTKGVVVSTAIENDNPDIQSAGKLGVPVIHRARMLARLIGDSKCVAVTGTSGKSTVTGMIGWILEQTGYNPIVVNGGVVINWCNEKTIGNVRHGAGDLWVIEADESDRSLMEFNPDWAIITNISKDHFETDETIRLFKDFSRRVKQWRVSLLDEPDIFHDFNPYLSASGSSFRYGDTVFTLNITGKHNAENALLAVIFCVKFGVDPEKIAEALSSFRGIQRRLEIIGSINGVTVIDDYAHNPAKISAVWRAMSAYHKRVIGVWRPHGFGPLRNMMKELEDSFGAVCRGSDSIYLLPVYDAGGTADRSLNSDNLAEKLIDRGLRVKLAEDVNVLAEEIAANAETGDAVLIMGARDPGLPILARQILTELKKRSCRLQE